MSQTLFRVHFGDGQHIDLHAENPDDARKQARGKRPGEVVTKVKKWKGELPC